MFRYWLQGGRIKVGFLGARKIDQYANLQYNVSSALRQTESSSARRRRRPGRLPPPVARSSFIMAQGKRSFVDKLDFVTVDRSSLSAATVAPGLV
jgi:glutaconate CoA-transferase subunit B